MTLLTELEASFAADLAAYEEAHHMRYVTTIERRAEQRGLEQATRRNIMDALQVRFSNVPESLVTMLDTIRDPDVLRAVLRHAIVVESLAAFEGHVAQLVAGAASPDADAAYVLRQRYGWMGSPSDSAPNNRLSFGLVPASSFSSRPAYDLPTLSNLALSNRGCRASTEANRPTANYL